MRAVILAGVTALFLASCGGNDTDQGGAAQEQNVASEVVATNDVTAIDAVTGEAANMAADVDYMPESLEDEADNVTSNTAAPVRGRTPARTQPRRTTTPAPAAEPAEPAENDTTE